jgi:hypothetical protein
MKKILFALMFLVAALNANVVLDTNYGKIELKLFKD